MKRPKGTQAWLLTGYIAVIVFIWSIDFLDLPHIIFGTQPTSINWEESILETGFIIIIWIINWKVINYYEGEWNKAATELQRLASTDSLTGALSRREFLARAEEEFIRAKRFERPFTCGIIDLDAFKSINDHFGHLAGDKVLAEFAQIASNNIRQQDFIGRLGGDEFGIAFVEATSKDAQVILQRIHEQWDKANLSSDDGIRLTISFSAGISSTHNTDQTLTDCIRRTDKALYEAKQRGKNRMEIV